MATATRPAAADTATSLREAVRHDGVHANSDSAAPVRGAAAAPPRQAGNNASRSAVRNGGGIKFGFLDLAGLQHCLRLRKTFAVTDALSGEVGLDYTLNTRAAVPQYSLAYQLQRKGRNFATLRATPQMLMLRKSFTFSPSKISFTLHTMAGVTYEGRPEFGVDVDNIKPMEVVVAAALGMLLFGKPLSGSRAFGGMQFGLPVNGDATAKGEAKAMVERHGKGVHVSLKQLNGVLRL